MQRLCEKSSFSVSSMLCFFVCYARHRQVLFCLLLFAVGFSSHSLFFLPFFPPMLFEIVTSISFLCYCFNFLADEIVVMNKFFFKFFLFISLGLILTTKNDFKRARKFLIFLLSLVLAALEFSRNILLLFQVAGEGENPNINLHSKEIFVIFSLPSQQHTQ